MTRLPVIVGFGGINPAGRSSGHHGYRRMVYDALDASKKASTIASLSALMGGSVTEEEALASTLIRKLEHNLFDPNYYRANRQAEIHGEGASPLSFKLKKNQLPEHIPPSWTVQDDASGMVMVTAPESTEVFFRDL